MRIKFFPIILIIIFFIIFIIFYKGLQNSNIYTPTVNIQKKIPVFETKIFNTNDNINSDKIFNSKKFYIMNIWSSWCVPCREEHSFLMDLSSNNNIEIIGLNYKDENINAKNFLKKLGSPYNLILSDIDGTIAIEWGAYGVPETFLIYDKEIIKKIVGPLNKYSLEEIKKLIK